MLTLSSGAVSEVKHCATYLKQRAETKNLHQSGTCKCRKKSAVNGLFCAMATYFELRTLGCTLQALVQRNPPQLTNRLTNVSYIVLLVYWHWTLSMEWKFTQKSYVQLLGCVRIQHTQSKWITLSMCTTEWCVFAMRICNARMVAWSNWQNVRLQMHDCKVVWV